MSIQLIVMDMDGTLLDADHVTVPGRNIEALQRASQQGVKLAIASGRTWSLIENAVEQLGMMDYAILSNGAAVQKLSAGERLWERLIPNRQALQIIDLLHNEDIPFEVYCQGQNYVRQRERELLRNNNLAPAFAEFFETRTVYSQTLAQALAGRDVEKFNIFYVPPEKRERVQAMALATGPLEVSNAFQENMEFAAGGVSKGAALQALAARLGLTADQVMVFGDAGNDLEMLSWAEWSFAMENATAQAKAAAKYVTAANTQAGVGQAVEKFVLGEKTEESTRGADENFGAEKMDFPS